MNEERSTTWTNQNRLLFAVLAAAVVVMMYGLGQWLETEIVKMLQNQAVASTSSKIEEDKPMWQCANIGNKMTEKRMRQAVAALDKGK